GADPGAPPPGPVARALVRGPGPRAADAPAPRRLRRRDRLRSVAPRTRPEAARRRSLRGLAARPPPGPQDLRGPGGGASLAGRDPHRGPAQASPLPAFVLHPPRPPGGAAVSRGGQDPARPGV